MCFSRPLKGSDKEGRGGDGKGSGREQERRGLGTWGRGKGGEGRWRVKSYYEILHTVMAVFVSGSRSYRKEERR